jgi:thiosulfate dehydrogenase [quinone] large subunit
MVAWAAARLALAAIFLWAFLDKAFGLGYATPPTGAWMRGGSPTNGFLSHAGGWFAAPFHAIAGNPVTDALFMAALAGVGLALLLGIGLRVAAASGSLLLLAMYAAATPGVPATTNPAVDDHIVDACLLIGLALVGAGRVMGLGLWWSRLPFVQRHPFLK